ncbi:hypothetical protein AZA_54302 [Nitrospirillum viridazoti Y2]|nr:hypothetical protein AZA_54302 [Nitrospirillum amazonense Y2]
MALRVGRQVAQRHQLAEHRLPVALGNLRTTAEGLQLVMAEAHHLFGGAAAQHVDQVAHPEFLAGAVDGRQRLLRRHRAVPGFHRFEAGVAVAAVAGMFLPEIGQQHLAAAVGGLAEAQQGIQLAPLRPLVLGAAVRGVHHLAQHDHILQAVQHQGVGGQAIAAGAAGFLIIGFQAFGRVHVHDESDVGLVDAHAEGDGRHHHHALALDEAVLVGLAHRRVQAGMIGQGVQPLVLQPVGQRLHPGARQAIDDARVLRMVAADEVQQLPALIVLGRHAIGDVGPVEAGDELPRLAQSQALHDVGLGLRVGRGRQRDARHGGETLVQHRQLQVFRPEVVAPLADAVRLVQGEQADARPVQQLQEARGDQPLRRHVQQVQIAPLARPLHIQRLAPVQGGVQVGGAHTGLPQRVHLVAHQGDQGTDDDGDARPRQGRDLETQRLAAAGGHQHQGVAALDDVGDDVFLVAAESGITVDALQDVPRRRHRVPRALRRIILRPVAMDDAGLRRVGVMVGHEVTRLRMAGVMKAGIRITGVRKIRLLIEQAGGKGPGVGHDGSGAWPAVRRRQGPGIAVRG